MIENEELPKIKPTDQKSSDEESPYEEVEKIPITAKQKKWAQELVRRYVDSETSPSSQDNQTTTTDRSVNNKG